jgi:hypothetical protein
MTATHLGAGATPLNAGHGYARRFPYNALPQRMREYAVDLAVRKQVPVDLPALVMLGIISSIAAPRIVIRRDRDWTQPTNLYIACGLESSAGKSPVFEELRKGVQAAEFHLIEKHRDKVAAQLAAMRQEVEDKRKLANQPGTLIDQKEILRERAKRIEADAEEMTKNPPPDPELVYDGDLTVEALGSAMAENSGSGPVIDDEGTFLRNLAGQYSGQTGNLGLVLVGYDCRYYKPRRINRATKPIKRAALSLVLSPQPSIIASMKNNYTMSDLGFINRFIVCVPGDLIGERVNRPATYVDDSPGEDLGRVYRRWWSDLLKSIAEYDVIGDLDDDDATTIDLTREAFKLHYEYAEELEQAVRHGGPLRDVKSWAMKEAGRTLRVAAALHLGAGMAAGDRVSEQTMDNAICISRWYTEHFLHAGNVVGLSEGAEYIAEYVTNMPLQAATRSDLVTQVFRGHIRKGQLDAYLSELVGTGRWELAVGQSEKGRPPQILKTKRA